MFGGKELYKKASGVKTRWASAENPTAKTGSGGQASGGRKGSPCFFLAAGQSYVLAEEKSGSGTVRRIWMTISQRDALMLRGLRLDFYWDGQAKPAVSAPVGDFFGTGLGRMTPFQSALFSSPEGRSFNCAVPMPFRNGMKIVLTNESGQDLRSVFYEVNYTVGDEHDDDTLYFHACYRRENPTRLQEDYEILPQIKGKGRFLGCNIGIIANTDVYFSTWWGEGEVKIYLDGDTTHPTLCGTGTEDYIGTAYGQGRFDHLFQGCHVADHEKLEFCFYRYHIPDPVYFDREIRATIQQIGYWSESNSPLFLYNKSQIYSTSMEKMDFAKEALGASAGIFERHDDWSSCAYFYLDSPVNDLPALAPAKERFR